MTFVFTFLEGLATFLSPCFLPLLPLYLAYLGGGASGSLRKRMCNSLAFVAGFTVVFVLLGALSASLGYLLRRHQGLLSLLAGLVVMAFGLQYLGLLPGAPFKGGLGQKAMTRLHPGKSFLFGLAFSIAWTPCLGTFLGAALMLAGQRGRVVEGVGLLFAYSLGLGLPFLFMAFLLDRLEAQIAWVKAHFGLLQKICGLALVLLGLLMASGRLNGLGGGQAEKEEVRSSPGFSFSEAGANTEAISSTSSEGDEEAPARQASEAPKEPDNPFVDFSMEGQMGEDHLLSEYGDKPIVLNFWASWCPPCRAEMPIFEQAYLQYRDRIHFIMLNMMDGVRETRESARRFLQEADYPFPLYYDSKAAGVEAYRVAAFPTTIFMKKGQVIARIQGMVDEDQFQALVHQLLEEKE